MTKISGDLFINGKWTKGLGPRLQSKNPATGQIIFEGNEASQSQIHDAVIGAKQAFSQWRSRHVDERMHFISRFSEEVLAHEQELATLISQEMGKPLWDSFSEVRAMAGKAAISLQAYKERCQTKRIELPHASLHITHKPYGAVAVLGPFNFPAHLPHGQIIPALIAGNCVIFKPSEYTPAVAEFCIHLWQKAGLPHGVINLIQGAKEVGSMLLEEDLRGVFFTGSLAAGHAIGAHAMRFRQRICALEMGGNNPLIISKTHSLEASVAITMQSAYISTGQRCSAAKRVIVMGEQNQFLDLLIEKTKTLSIGAYDSSPEPFMGPVVTKEAGQKIMAQYHAIQGKKVLLEMKHLQDNTAFVTPGIIDVTDIAVEDEEIFGPLIQIIRVKNLHEAIEQANNTRYGLAAGIITDDPKEIQIALDKLEAGVINCNSPLTGASSYAPFGGIKDSGNYQPAGYYACDFTAYPVSSTIQAFPQIPAEIGKRL